MPHAVERGERNKSAQQFNEYSVGGRKASMPTPGMGGGWRRCTMMSAKQADGRLGTSIPAPKPCYQLLRSYSRMYSPTNLDPQVYKVIEIIDRIQYGVHISPLHSCTTYQSLYAVRRMYVHTEYIHTDSTHSTGLRVPLHSVGYLYYIRRSPLRYRVHKHTHKPTQTSHFPPQPRHVPVPSTYIHTVHDPVHTYTRPQHAPRNKEHKHVINEHIYSVRTHQQTRTTPITTTPAAHSPD